MLVPSLKEAKIRTNKEVLIKTNEYILKEVNKKAKYVYFLVDLSLILCYSITHCVLLCRSPQHAYRC